MTRAPRRLGPSEKSVVSWSITPFARASHQLAVLYPSAIIRQQGGYKIPEWMERGEWVEGEARWVDKKESIRSSLQKPRGAPEQRRDAPRGGGAPSRRRAVAEISIGPSEISIGPLLKPKVLATVPRT